MKIFDWSIATLLILCCGLSLSGVSSVTEFGSKDGYVDAAQAQVSRWRQRVAQLKTEQALVATDSERFEALEKHVGTLEAKLNNVEAAVEKLRVSAEHGWIRAKRRIDREFSELETTHLKMNTSR